MNTTHEIRKFYFICCPDDRLVVAREGRGLDSGRWWDEDVWELQEISRDQHPIGPAACMSRSGETTDGWSVVWEGSHLIVQDEAIRHACQYLAEELG